MVFEFCCFFFKQKTAYEMRISDWSSDVCSSDLPWDRGPPGKPLDSAALPLLQGRQGPTGNGMSAGKRGDSKSGSLCRGLMAGKTALPGAFRLPRCRGRSEERRVGKGCVSQFRSRLSPYNTKKHTNQKQKK